MPLTPAEVHNVAFKKPPIGKRGYDEEEVDAFLDIVEVELARLIEENNDLAHGSGAVGRPGAVAPAAAARPAATAAELAAAREENARLQNRVSELERAVSQGKDGAQQQVVQLQQQLAQTEQQLAENRKQLEQAQQRWPRPSAPPRRRSQTPGNRGRATPRPPRLDHRSPRAGGADARARPADGRPAPRAVQGRGRAADRRGAAERGERPRPTRTTGRTVSWPTPRRGRSSSTRRAATRAAQTVQDAEQRAATITAQFEQRKAALERRVEELRTFEREYRTRLKSYLESQLRDLDASGKAEPSNSAGRRIRRRTSKADLSARRRRRQVATAITSVGEVTHDGADRSAVVAVVSLVLGLALTSTGVAGRLAGRERLAAVVLVLLVRAQRRTAKSHGHLGRNGCRHRPAPHRPTARPAGRRPRRTPPKATSTGGPTPWSSTVNRSTTGQAARTSRPSTPRTIPLAQAIEDGFAPCSDLQARTDVPQAGSAGASGPGQPASAHDGAPLQVWVIDGRPDYHLAGCSQLADGDGEVVPRAQAVEDGFQPCSACRPDELTASTTTEPSQDAAARDATPETVESPAEREMALVGAGAATSATTMTMPVSGRAGVGGGETTGAMPQPGGPAEVWVADGYPEYHVEACGELRGLSRRGRPVRPGGRGRLPALRGLRPGRRRSRPAAGDHCGPADDDGDDAAGAADADAGDAAQRRGVGRRRHARTTTGDGCARLAGQRRRTHPAQQAVEDGFRAVRRVHTRQRDPAEPRTRRPAGSSEPTAVSATPVVRGVRGRLGRRRLPGLSPARVPADARAWTPSRCRTTRPSRTVSPRAPPAGPRTSTRRT